MAEAFDTANEAIDSLEGDETYDEAEYPLRDFASKEVSVFLSTRVRALEEGVLPPGSVDAEDVAFTPTGTIAATDVQSAIAEVAAEAGGGGGWPVEALIVAIATPKNQTNFDNVAASIQSQYVAPFGVVTSDNTDGAFIEWDVALKSGTWALTVKGWKHDGAGIIQFGLNDGGGLVDIDASPYDASSGTYDGYSASSDATENPENVATDLTIPDDGVYTLRATVDGKNGSSSGFATNLCFVYLRRVGA